MRSKVVFIFLAVMAVAPACALAADSKPTAKSLGESLMCHCGCHQTVGGCNHLNCSSHSEMQDLIQKEIAAGKDETTILQDFVLRYGVEVLSTPPARGFNLAVWVLPGVGLIGGLGILIWLTRRWRVTPARPRAAAPSSVDPKLVAAVEEEMKKSGIGG